MRPGRFCAQREGPPVRWIVATLVLLAGWTLPSGSGSAAAWRVPARKARKTNPIPADARSLERAEHLYVKECLGCHGPSGKGDGPSARDLERPIGDLTAEAALAQSDGALFWKMTVGRRPMPAYGQLLTDAERWHLVNYVRSLVATGPQGERGATGTLASRTPLSQTTTTYLSVGRALVAADPSGAARQAVLLSEAVATLSRQRAVPALQDAVSRLRSAGDLRAQRIAFQEVSARLREIVGQLGRSAVEPLYCYRSISDTTGARRIWLQEGGDPKDPYQDGRAAGNAELLEVLRGAPVSGASR